MNAFSDDARKPGSDRAYDGRTVFLPISDALRPGDLILTRNREGDSALDRKMSAGIARLTGGRFSHVMICSVPPTLVEAMPAGVGTLSLQRCYAHSLDDVRVLRHPDPRIARTAGSLVLPNIGRTYSISRAAISPLPTGPLGSIKDRGVFCSALAAQVFREAGAGDIFTRPPEKTTPSTIEHYPGLINVTYDLFREELAPRNIEQMAALDGERRSSPSDRQTTALLRYGAATFERADSLVRNHPEAGLERPTSFFMVLQLIVDAFRAASRVDDPLNFGEEVAALDAEATILLAEGELAAVAQEMLQLDSASLQQALRESFNPEPDINVENLQGVLRTTEVQIGERQASIEGFRVDAWPTGRSKAIALWLEMQELVVAAARQRATLIEEILARLNGP